MLEQSDMRALRSMMSEVMDEKFEAFEEKVDAKFEAFEEKVDAKFEAFEEKVDAKFEAFEEKVDAKFEAFEEKVDAKFEAFREEVDEKIDVFRKETDKKVDAKNHKTIAMLLTEMDRMQKNLEKQIAAVDKKVEEIASYYRIRKQEDERIELLEMRVTRLEDHWNSIGGSMVVVPT